MGLALLSHSGSAAVIPRLLLIPLLGAFVAGCAASTVHVGSHADPALGQRRYSTYAWGPADSLPLGDPRLDSDADFRDRMEGAIDRELTRKGYRRGQSPPDLLVHYHATIRERLDVNRLDDLHAYCAGDTCDTGIIEYEAGTFVLDIIDTRTNRLVWRGWAQDRIEPALGNPDRMRQLINEAVRRMLDRFPTR